MELLQILLFVVVPICVIFDLVDMPGHAILLLVNAFAFSLVAFLAGAAMAMLTAAQPDPSRWLTLGVPLLLGGLSLVPLNRLILHLVRDISWGG